MKSAQKDALYNTSLKKFKFNIFVDIYLKSLILVGYAVGVLGVLFNKELRRNNKIILILMTIYFVTMSLLDGQKLAVYLIYIVPFYTVLFAVWLYAAWEKRWFPRPLLILTIAGFLLITKRKFCTFFDY